MTSVPRAATLTGPWDREAGLNATDLDRSGKGLDGWGRRALREGVHSGLVEELGRCVSRVGRPAAKRLVRVRDLVRAVSALDRWGQVALNGELHSGPAEELGPCASRAGPPEAKGMVRARDLANDVSGLGQALHKNLNAVPAFVVAGSSDLGRGFAVDPAKGHLCKDLVDSIRSQTSLALRAVATSEAEMNAEFKTRFVRCRVASIGRSSQRTGEHPGDLHPSHPSLARRARHEWKRINHRIALASPDPGTMSARTRAAIDLREDREVLDFALAAQIRIVDHNSRARIVRNLAGNPPTPSAVRAIRKGVRRHDGPDRIAAIPNNVSAVRRIMTKVPNDLRITDHN